MCHLICVNITKGGRLSLQLLCGLCSFLFIKSDNVKFFFVFDLIIAARCIFSMLDKLSTWLTADAVSLIPDNLSCGALVNCISGCREIYARIVLCHKSGFSIRLLPASVSASSSALVLLTFNLWLQLVYFLFSYFLVLLLRNCDGFFVFNDLPVASSSFSKKKKLCHTLNAKVASHVSWIKFARLQKSFFLMPAPTH